MDRQPEELDSPEVSRPSGKSTAVGTVDRFSVITGVFGFSGRHIALKLLERGEAVRTLTNHPDPSDPLSKEIGSVPLKFDDPGSLRESLRGASTLYNTYWIRFEHGKLTFDGAVKNSIALVRAAVDAGVRKIVHVSIANPSEESPLPYYHGKALVEKAIVESGLKYAILRPTVIFGDKGILLNTIAWMLRRSPIFPIPGDGEYKLQPVYVEDLAELAIRLANEPENTTVDAVGPETYSFNGLLELMKEVLRSITVPVHISPSLAQTLSRLPGLVLGDVILTKDEVTGLMDNLLISHQPPTCETRYSDWLRANAYWLGKHYMSEIGKHYK